MLGIVGYLKGVTVVIGELPVPPEEHFTTAFDMSHPGFSNVISGLIEIGAINSPGVYQLDFEARAAESFNLRVIKEK